MGQASRNAGGKAFTAGEDLEAYRRVKIESGTTTIPPEVVYADAGEPSIGMTAAPAKDGEILTVEVETVFVVASEAFSVGASLYGAADGKVADTENGDQQLIAIEAATASGDVVEAIKTPGYLNPAMADPGDEGALPVSTSGSVAITTAGAETRTLAIPGKAGTTLVLSLDVDGGNCVVTAAAAINQTGNDTITMADAGDTIVLTAVQVASALVWRVVVNDGCTLTTA